MVALYELNRTEQHIKTLNMAESMCQKSKDRKRLLQTVRKLVFVSAKFIGPDPIPPLRYVSSISIPFRYVCH